jgi:LPXTG-motif cell wall-anchored protein
MDYRKKTKICLDKPAADTQAQAAVSVQSIDDLAAPNTGIGGGSELLIVASVVIIAVALALFFSKKSKKVFFIFALLFGVISFIAPIGQRSVFAEGADLSDCQKIGFSGYDIVARLGYDKSIYDGDGNFVKEEWVTEKEIIIAGTGSRDNDLQKLADGPEQEFHKYLEDEIKQEPGLNYSLYPPVEPDVDSEDQIFNFDYIFWY